MVWKILWTTSTPSRQLWVFKSPLTRCHSFPTTLKGATREWFIKLPTSSIDSFKQLGNFFLRHFFGEQHPKRLIDHLLICEAFHQRNLRGRWNRWQSVAKDLQSWIEVQRVYGQTHEKSSSNNGSLKAQKYMNAKDALVAVKDKEKPREREGKGEDWRERKRERGDR